MEFGLIDMEFLDFGCFWGVFDVFWGVLLQMPQGCTLC
jgi:peptide methionine sulfoxide reductase MsrA